MGFFIYDAPVSGKNFIGREQELTILGNQISQGVNAAIYGIPKSGKKSLVSQAILNTRFSGKTFTSVRFSLLNTRTVADFAIRLGTEVLKSFCDTPSGFNSAMSLYLGGTHFIFDPDAYTGKGQVISLNWDIDENDLRAMASLPYAAAADRGERFIICIEEFQNIMLTEDGDKVCKILSEVFREHGQADDSPVSYVFTGSAVNAMKDIFEVRKMFYRTVEVLDFAPIDTKTIVNHVIKGFLTGGKVSERERIESVCHLFRNNIWYINHFASLCDTLSKGYMLEPILQEALSELIAIHEPRFIETVNGLTTYQVCLLRAVIDGHKKFSSSEVIRRYNLNSSANVKRLRDALCKKEIITFDKEDNPVILDPLFEYWVRKYFFEIRGE